MAIQEHRTFTNGKATIPPDLKHNIERFLECVRRAFKRVDRFMLTIAPRNLKTINQEITKIRDIVKSKRKRHKLAAVFMTKAHSATLQKCRADLDWAIKTFDVSTYFLITSNCSKEDRRSHLT